MDNPYEIKVWAQMFFDDGSITQGIRVSSIIYEDEELLRETSEKLLKSVNRTEGFLLVWGAGEISYKSYFTSFLALELDSSASLSTIV